MSTLKLFPLMFAVLFLVACHGITESVNRNDVTGIYYLVKVDGSAVPTEVSHDSTVLKVRSGIFMISDDGTCVSRTHFIPPGGEEIIREARATYQLENSRLTMSWERAGVTEGTVEGDTFVMDNHGMIFEYKRGG